MYTTPKTMHFKPMYTTYFPCFPKKAHTLAGIDPGYSVLQADAMTNAKQKNFHR
jgi:hypothetical protein